jgi:hypothetical protein
VGRVGDRYDNALAIIGCTRRSSSAGADRGRASTTSSTARSSGRIGSTTDDSWSRSATSHPPSPRRPTTRSTLQDSQNPASGEPGGGSKWGHVKVDGFVVRDVPSGSATLTLFLAHSS